jgi:hypothetical protein
MIIFLERGLDFALIDGVHLRWSDPSVPPRFIIDATLGTESNQENAQTFLDGSCAAEFLSTHSEQIPDCFFHKPLKKCLRHKILRHCLQAAPLNSPNVRLQMPQINGAMEIGM